MKRIFFTKSAKLLVAAFICFTPKSLWAVTEVNVETAGTLSTLLTSTDKELKVTGVINGTDIKYIRQLVTAGALISIDFPLSLKKIDSWSFSRTGLSKVVVPDNVTTIGGDAFSYCKSLHTLVLGKGVKTLESGVFFACDNLLNVYAQPLTPPTRNGVLEYLFSMGDKAVAARVIHVYPSAVEAYINAGWGMYGTIVGDLTSEMLDAIESPEADNPEIWSKIQEDNQCYDLFGRKVTNIMPGTIYIRNGKKFIYK